MARYVDEDLHGAEFRECDLTGARLIGVVMQDAVIDGLITNLVVNGVEVTEYVEAEPLLLNRWSCSGNAERRAGAFSTGARPRRVPNR